MPQFKEGGLLWFTDLTSSDPYYILPILSSAGILAILEVGREFYLARYRVLQLKKKKKNMEFIRAPFNFILLFFFQKKTQAGTEAGMANPQTNMMKNVFRVMTVVMIPFTAWLPTVSFLFSFNTVLVNM